MTTDAESKKQTNPLLWKRMDDVKRELEMMGVGTENIPATVIRLIVIARMKQEMAIAHDMQPYPTVEAYERVCAELSSVKQERDEIKGEVEIRRLEGIEVSEYLGLPEATTLDAIVAAFGRKEDEFKRLRIERDEARDILRGFCDSDLCSCGVGIGDPNYHGIHTPFCVRVAEFLRSLQLKDSKT